MPELPEVETTLRGIAPLLTGQKVRGVTLRTAKLRWPLDSQLGDLLAGRELAGVRRRAKYLLFDFKPGSLLVHLGMSGSLRVVPVGTPPGKHDHVDLLFANHKVLRLNDPRKFGAVLWIDGHAEDHRLLAKLGPEPLDDAFCGEYLYRIACRRRVAVKSFVMSQNVVVGVGNIYASEALFRARIRPDRHAGKVGLESYSRLVVAIREVLRESISAGGTTLQDFRQSDGRPGYFKQDLQVYGRAGEPCPVCDTRITAIRLAQRSTFFCRHCQH